MHQISTCTSNLTKEDLAGIYKTLVTFLKNQRFYETCNAFQKDAGLSGDEFSQVSSKAVFLKPSEEDYERVEVRIDEENGDSKVQDDGPPPEYSKINKCDIQDDNKLDDFDKLKMKFEVLQQEYKKLMGVATELTCALHSNVLGQTEHMNKTLDACKNIYPELFANVSNTPSGSSSITAREIKERLAPFNASDEYFNKSFDKSDQSNCALTEDVKDNTKMGEVTVSPPPNLEADVDNGVLNTSRDVSITTLRSLSPMQTDSGLLNEMFGGNTLNVVQAENEKKIDNLNRDCSARVNAKEIVEEVFSQAVTEADNTHSKSSDLNVTGYFLSNEDVLDPFMINGEKRSESFVYLYDENVEVARTRDKSTEVVSNGESRTSYMFDGFTLKTDTEVTSDEMDSVVRNGLDPRLLKTEQESMWADLNFYLIKQDLLKSKTSHRKSLMKSLRLILTVNTLTDRDKIMTSYITHDLLMLGENKNMIEIFLNDANVSIQESMLKFINAIASLNLGRQYLSTGKCRCIKKILLPTILNEQRPPSNVKFDMLIATLQKLSLEGSVREIMIGSGTFEYLLEYCVSVPAAFLSDYRWEFVTAWLMNLSLEQEVWELCANHRNCTLKVVRIVTVILDNGKLNCLPYLIGMMYTLLAHPHINRDARLCGLQEVLLQHVDDQCLDNNIKRQLEHIVRSRLKGDVDFGKLKNDILLSHQPLDNEDLLQPVEGDSDHLLTKDFSMLESYKKGFSGKSNLSTLMSTETVPPTKPPCPKQKTAHSNPIVFKSGTNYNKASTTPIVMKDKIIKNFEKQKKKVKKFGLTGPSPLCYMEICYKLGDTRAPCDCAKCSGGNRYSCKCYDLLKRELEEDVIDIIKEKEDKLILEKFSSAKRGTKIENKSKSESTKSTPSNVTGKSNCRLCGDKICDCAFESRPRIKRTP